MKKNITLLLLSMAAISATSFAQPVITSSITTYPTGFTDSAYGASPTVLPGAGGANVNWDMSTNTTVFAAKLTVVTVASTPYAATFPSASYAVKVEASSTVYNYSRQSAAGIENVALTYGGTGVGTDFSPNLRMSVPFPFNYLDSKSDTFQTTTSGPDTVRLTYDGYGTLKTPFNNYPNVIRIKEDYGTSVSYSWYTVSPFALVMNYSSASNNYVITTTPVGTTGVSNTSVAAQAVIYPNPATNEATITWEAEGTTPATVTLIDIAGRTLKNITVAHDHTLNLNVSDLNAGTYFVQVTQAGKTSVQQLVVAH